MRFWAAAVYIERIDVHVYRKRTRVVWVLLCILSLSLSGLLLYRSVVCVCVLYCGCVLLLLGAQHLILLMPSDRKLSYILLNCWWCAPSSAAVAPGYVYIMHLYLFIDVLCVYVYTLDIYYLLRCWERPAAIHNAILFKGERVGILLFLLLIALLFLIDTTI